MADIVAAASPTAGSTAPDAGASTLGDEIGALLGDYDWGSGDTESSESPESTDPSAAGAPPADAPAASSDPSSPDAPASPAIEHAGAPPAVAAAPPAPADDDLLKDSAPLTYVVNGQTRTEEGITRLGDRGAFITAEHLPRIQQRLSERDHLFEKSQADYETSKALAERYDSLEKLVAWNTKGADDTPIVLTGRDAVEARLISMAEAVAERDALREILSSPDRMMSLLQLKDPANPDAGIIHNQVAFDNAILRMQGMRRDVVDAVRKHVDSLVPRSAFSGQRPTLQTETTAPVTAEQITQVAPQALEAVVNELQITGLTADDKASLSQAIVPYIRATTAEDKRANPSLGPLMVDPKFVPIARHFQKVRSDAQAVSAKMAAATTQAATENAAKLAAAAAGTHRPGVPVAPARQAAPSAEAAEAAQRAQEDAWRKRESTMAALI